MSWTYRVRKKAINAAEIEYGIIEYYTTADSDGWTEWGAIQSDAALRQSIEPRQMAAATLGDGALLAIL